MKTTPLACVIVALSLTCFSLAEAQSDGAPEVDDEIATPSDVEEPAERAAREPAPIVRPEEPVQLDEPTQAQAAMAQQLAAPQVRLRFRSIRLYAGSELRMAPIDAPSAFETVCELPCNVDVAPGEYRLNVRREDGREYFLPTSMDFDVDARISLKYGAGTGSWVGGIVALTGILGIIITGGIAIAGAANDDSGQRTGGLVGLAVSSVVFGAGLVTFLLSERGLRAQVLEAN